MAVKVITIQLPGAPGTAGPQGIPGPVNVLSIGSLTTGAEGTMASATITGVAPTQTLHLTIPRGNTGLTGPPANLTIGTITTGLPNTPGAASITGNSPDFILNLTLPRGYGIPLFGNAGQVVVKNSTTENDTGWLTTDTAATAGALVKRDGNADTTVRYLNLSGTSPGAGQAVRKDYADALGTAGDSADTIVRRNSQNGFAAGYVNAYQFNATEINLSGTTPTAGQVVRKDYVDTQIGTRAPTVHTHTVSQLSDSTAIGRSLILAADAAAVRTAINASDAGHTHADLTNATDLATASTLVKRDAAGRFDATDPAAASDVATKNYTDTTVSTHAALTAAHGATGSVVGTSNSQNLTNKTLTSASLVTPSLSPYMEITEATTPAAPGSVNIHRFYVDNANQGMYYKNSAFTRRLTTNYTPLPSHYTNSATLNYGDTYYNTVLQSQLMWDGSRWIQAAGPLQTTQTFRVNTLNTNSALIPVGFEVRESDTLRELRWDGVKWWKTNGITEILYSAVNGGGAVTNSGTLTPLHSTTINAGALVAGPLSFHCTTMWTAGANAAAYLRLSIGNIVWGTTRLHNFGSSLNQFTMASVDGMGNMTATGNNVISFGVEVDPASSASVTFYQNYLEIKF